MVKEYSGNYLYQTISFLHFSFITLLVSLVSFYPLVILPHCHSRYTRPLDDPFPLASSPSLDPSPPETCVHVASFCLELHLRHFTSNHLLVSPYMRTGGKGRRGFPDITA